VVTRHLVGFGAMMGRRSPVTPSVEMHRTHPRIDDSPLTAHVVDDSAHDDSPARFRWRYAS